MSTLKEVLIDIKSKLEIALVVNQDLIKIYKEQVIDECSPNPQKKWVELGELYYSKPNDEDPAYREIQTLSQFSQGNYKIVVNERTVSSWKLYELPHCCAYMVSCNVQIALDFRNKKIGKILNLFRIEIGRQLGYTAILCTDIEQNVAQRKILKDNGWVDIHSLVNKITKNKVHI